MNWVKNLVSRKTSRANADDEGVQYTTEPISMIEDIPFSNDEPGKHLKQLWDQFDRVPDQNQKVAFAKFLKEFMSMYSSWDPNQDHAVQGHPMKVIETLAQKFNKRATSISIALRRENNDKLTISLDVVEVIEILSRSPHNRYLLKHFDIFSRMVTILQSIHTALVKINNVDSTRTDDGSREEKIFEFIKSLLLTILKIISHFVNADNFASEPQQQQAPRCAAKGYNNNPLVLKIRQRVMIQYLSEVRVFEALADILPELHAYQALQDCKQRQGATIIDLQRVILNIVRAVILAPENPSDDDKFTLAGGLRALISWLGWPSAFNIREDLTSWRDFDIDKVDEQKLTEQYQLQMDILQIFTEALISHPHYIYTLDQLGFFDKTIEVGFWISFFYSSKEDEETKQNLLQRHMQPLEEQASKQLTETPLSRNSPFNNVDKFKTHSSQFVHEARPETQLPCPKIPSLGHAKLNRYFECLAMIITSSVLLTGREIQYQFDNTVSLANSTLRKTIGTTGNNNSTTLPKINTTSAYSQTQERAACLLLDLFIPSPSEGANIKYSRSKMRHLLGFQFHFLDLLFSLVQNVHKSLEIFVQHHLYDILFSEYFYFFGSENNIVIAKSRVEEEELAAAHNSSFRVNNNNHSDSTDDLSWDRDSNDNYNGKEVKTVQDEITEIASIVLREYTLDFMKYTATIPDRNNYEECRKLIELIGMHVSNSYLVTEIGATLFDVLYNNFKCTQQSLLRLEALSVVSHSIQVQHEKTKLLPKPKVSILMEPESDYTKALEARNILLSVMDISLISEESKLNALRDANTINALFTCLFDSTLKDFALTHIFSLMNARTDDPEVFILLISRYTEMFPVIQDKPTPENMQLLWDMLEYIQNVMKRENRRVLQKTFKHKLYFLTNLLNYEDKQFEQTIITETELCVHVLKTLAALLSHNSKAKEQFRKEIGYDQLTQVILRCYKNKPTRDLFAQLLNMLVDGQFDVEKCYKIENPDIIPVLFHLCCKCELTFATEFLDTFIEITEKSINNQSSCCSVNTMGVLLEMVIRFNAVRIRDRIVQLIEILGKHSINVKELKGFFTLIKNQSSEIKSALLAFLLKSLQNMTNKDGPESYFDCDGQNSGIILPTIKGWPSTRGYSICLWLRVEDFDNAHTQATSNVRSGKYEPRLISFLNTEEQGFEFYFEKNFLVVSITTANGKQYSQVLDCPFEPKRWYFVGIVHTCGKGISFNKSEIRLHIDDKLRNKALVKYPTLSKPLDRCRIGTCHDPLSGRAHHQGRHTFLNGQIGAIYLFDEALTDSQLKGIYRIGPNHMSNFQSPEPGLVNDYIDAIFDGSLSSKIFLCYNPKASEGKRLWDNTPDSVKKPDMNAKIMKGTRVCITHKVQDIIGCLGGIKVLFPLFLQMDQLSSTEESPEELDPYMTVQLLTLIRDLLYKQRDNQEDMARCHGFMIINFLLRKMSPQHLTIPAIRIFQRILQTVKDNEVLYQEAVLYLFFDFKLWIYAAPEVQKFLVEVLIDATEQNPQVFRKLIGVQKILDIMRSFYWFIQEPDSLGTDKICNPVTKAILGMRPPDVDVAEIRALLLKLIKVMTNLNVTQDEMQSFVMFAATCPDPHQLNDVLKLVVELMFSNNPAVFDYLAALNGWECFMHLLHVDNEQVRITALECMGRMLKMHPKTRQKVQADTVYGFVEVTRILSAFPFTKPVYRALRSILLGEVTYSGQAALGNTYELMEEESHHFEIPAVLQTIFKLLLGAENNVKQSVAQDFILLFKAREESRDVFLRQTGWQNWLFDLIATDELDTNTAPGERAALAVKDIIIELFKILLFHALKTDKAGYKTFEETLAYLYKYEERRVLDSYTILESLYTKILDAYIVEVEREVLKTIDAAKSSPIMHNFLHLVHFIEEFLFYNKGIIDSLSRLRHQQQQSSMQSNIDVQQPLESPSSATSNYSPKLQPLTTAFDESNTPPTPTTASMFDGKDSPKMKSVNSIYYGTGTGFMTPTDLPINASPPTSPLSSGSFDLNNNNALPFAMIPLSYDSEREIVRDENGTWIGLHIAEKVLLLFDKWKLSSYANFHALNALIMEGKKYLRAGGTLRITLRLLRYAMRENSVLDIKNTQYVRQILKRDVEAEKERLRFAELWSVTGDVDEGDELHSRLLYVLAFLFDTLAQFVDRNRKDYANTILQLIKLIFMSRKAMLKAQLKGKDGKSLLRSDFAFFNNSAGLEEYNATVATAQWQYAWRTYFIPAVRKVDEEEAAFLGPITKRRRTISARVTKRITQMFAWEADHERRLAAESKKFKDKSIEEKDRRIAVYNSYEDINRTAARLWQQIMRNVSSERGPWGTPVREDEQVLWKIDKTEDRSRRRRKLKRDYTAAARLEVAKKSSHSEFDGQVPSPTHGSSLLLKKNQSSFFIPNLSVVSKNSNNNLSSDLNSANSAEEFEEWELETEADDNLGSIASPTSTTEVEVDASSKTADGKDKTLFTCYAEMITPMQAYSGRMDIKANSISWTADRENKCVIHGSTEVTEALQKTPKDRTWTKDLFKAIHLRRYRLQRTALEFFFTDSTSFMFNFSKKDRVKVFKKIISLKPPNLEQTFTSSEESLKKSNITQLWARRQISNFDYLMMLNTFAGRTYNDINQYPVFPWIIADYESDKLDLDNPKVYRDLSKPVGALNPSRLEEFIMRYESFPDDMPKFHYGSHYSSAGIVIYYMIRLEPFSTYALILQGGKFDHADRLFDSVPQTFRNCLTSTSDVKELIPEFYYLSEMFENRNNLDLGEKQGGRRLHDVILPKWAGEKNAAEEFVRINRAALESDYVSEHLHEWIDLIFGYKQRGKAAEEAFNVFHYSTYEGTVDLESLKHDPVMRASLESMIDNFGQTPIQLFTRPHIKRLKTEEAFNPFIREPVPMQLRLAQFISRSPLVEICLVQDRVITFSQNGHVAINRFTSSPSLNFTLDPLLATRRIGVPFAQEAPLSPHCFAVSPTFKDVVFSCAHWDNSFKCTQTSTATVLQSVWRHKDVVTCLALCDKDNKTLVSGSKDTTVMVWDLNPALSSSSPLGSGTLVGGVVGVVGGQLGSSLPILPNPRHILFGHDDEITCVAVNSDLDIVVSGSKDCTAIVHTLGQGRYVRSIKTQATIDYVGISNDGYIVIYSKDDFYLHVYSINGKLLNSVYTSERLNTIKIEGDYLIMGGDKKIVTVREIWSLKLVHKYDLSKDLGERAGASVRSVALSKDNQFLFVGLNDGHLAIYKFETTTSAHHYY